MQVFTGSEVQGSRVTVRYFLVSFVLFVVIFFLWKKNVKYIWALLKDARSRFINLVEENISI